jgi:hypothetical protein
MEGDVRYLILSLLLVFGFVLGGCSRTATDCSAADAQEATLSIVKEQLEKLTRQKIDSAEGHGEILNAKIRATIAQLKIILADVRTTKKDPNSSKRFCTAQLRVSFPDAVLADASKAREDAGATTISQLADERSVERDANAFSSDLSYNVQPTDAGDKVYAELEDAPATLSFYSEVVASHLLKASIEGAKSAAQEAAAQQQRNEQAALAEQQAAQTEQKQADLDQAKAENKLAVQMIGAIWNAVPRPTRDRLVDMQRAWIRKKNADCTIEAASASLDPLQKEAARLRCDTRAEQERAGWLRQYVVSDTNAATSGM